MRALLTLLLACSSSPNPAEKADGADTGEGAAALVPLAVDGLAAGVSEEQIGATIAALEAAGTRLTGSSGNAAARATIAEAMGAAGLAVEEDPFDFGSRSGVNLLGWKMGTDEPNVVYVFQAHYDSTSEDPEVSAPGADDNASGVAAMLEAARLIGAYDTRYTALFVATDGEEQGSKGSAHLVERLQNEGYALRGVIAPDMIGYWPLGEGDAFDILGDGDAAGLVDEMSAVADRLGVAHKVWLRHDYCYGDDHTMWQEAGVPAISPMDCVEAHNEPGSGEDTPHYHRTSDTIETVHLPFTARVTQVLVVTFAGWVKPWAG